MVTIDQDLGQPFDGPFTLPDIINDPTVTVQFGPGLTGPGQIDTSAMTVEMEPNLLQYFLTLIVVVDDGVNPPVTYEDSYNGDSNILVWWAACRVYDAWPGSRVLGEWALAAAACGTWERAKHHLRTSRTHTPLLPCRIGPRPAVDVGGPYVIALEPGGRGTLTLDGTVDYADVAGFVGGDDNTT